MDPSARNYADHAAGTLDRPLPALDGEKLLWTALIMYD